MASFTLKVQIKMRKIHMKGNLGNLVPHEGMGISPPNCLTERKF
jgi:hypothetical protein